MDQTNSAQILEKLRSPEGRKLIALMQKDGAAFSKAAAAAKTGDYSLAKSLIEPALSGTDATKLIETMMQNG